MNKPFRFTTVLMAASVLAACAQKESLAPEDNLETSKEAELVEMTFTAGVDTKAAFNADFSKILWQPKDKICIYSTDGTDIYANEFKDETLTSESEYASFTGTAIDKSPFYSAVYPFAAASGCDAEGNVTVKVPEIQTAVKGSFDPAASVAVAYTTSKDDLLSFKNICGWLGFEIADEYDTKVKSITLTAASGTVAGTVKVSGGGTPSLTAEASSGSVSIATASAENGLAAGMYYMSVLPGDIDGFEITVEFMDGRIGTKSTASPLTVVHNTYGTVMTVCESALDFTTEVVEVEATADYATYDGYRGATYSVYKPFSVLYCTGSRDAWANPTMLFDGDNSTAWVTYLTGKNSNKFGDPFIVIDLGSQYMIHSFGLYIDQTSDWQHYRMANIEYWVTNDDPMEGLSGLQQNLLFATSDVEGTNYDAYKQQDDLIRTQLNSMRTAEKWRVACGSSPFYDSPTWDYHMHETSVTGQQIPASEKATYRYVCVYMKLPDENSDLWRERNWIGEFSLKRYTWYKGYKFN